MGCCGTTISASLRSKLVRLEILEILISGLFAQCAFCNDTAPARRSGGQPVVWSGGVLAKTLHHLFWGS